MAEPIVEVLVRTARRKDDNRVMGSHGTGLVRSNDRARRLTIGACVAILGLAAGLRFPGLSHSSISTDEATSFQRASLSVPRCVATSTAKGQPPTFSVLTHALLRFGDSEAKLRAMPAVMGVLVVAAAMLLGWLALGARVAIAAGLLVALSPFAVRDSREALVYPLLGVAAGLVLSSVIFLAQNPERARMRIGSLAAPLSPRLPWRGWLGYVLGMLAALYIDASAAILFATCVACSALIVGSAVDQRGALATNWGLAHLAVLALWSPWLAKLWRAGHPIFTTGRASASAASVASGLSRLYLFAMLYNAWIAVLIAALFVAGCVALRKRDPALLSTLLTLALLPPLIALIAGVRAPLTLTRSLIWAPLPFYAIVAAGVFSFRPRVLHALVLVAIVGGGLWSTEHALAKRREEAAPWRDVAQRLSDDYDNDTVVFATHASERAALNYYFQRRMNPVLRVPITRPTTLEAARRALRGARTAFVVDTNNGVRPRTARLRALIEEHGTFADEIHIKNVTLLRFDLANSEAPAQDTAPPQAPPSGDNEARDDSFSSGDEQD